MDWLGLEMSTWESAGIRPKDRIARAAFRCTLDVPKDVKDPTMMLAAVNRYRLRVNGRTVMHGPARAPQMQCYADTIHLSAYLHAGKNQLEIVAEAYPCRPESAEHEGPQNLYRYDRGPMISPASDAFPELSDPHTWTVIPDFSFEPNAALSLLSGPSERICMKETGAAFPACSLGTAGSDPFGEIRLPEILPKPIPDMAREPGRFVSMPLIHMEKGTSGSAVLETKTLTTAVPAFEIIGGKGTEIRFLYAESYLLGKEGAYFKDVRSDITGTLQGVEDIVQPDTDHLVWEPLWFRAFRYIKVTVNAGETDVTVRPLGYTEMHYPLRSHTSVTAPESWIGRLFEMSRRTLENCMHDSYEDCPYYEQLQYMMDTRLEALYTHRLSGDTRLSRHAIRLFAASQTPSGLLQARYPSARMQIIPEFSLFFLEMLEDDYVQTGDAEFARSMLPTAFGIVQAFTDRITENGMFSGMGWWEFADWTEAWGQTRGTPTAALSEESALHNLHFVYALRCFSRLLRELGEKETAGKLELAAGRAATAVHHACYDLKRQMYREGRTTDEFSQHTQVWAVLCGLAEGDLARKALEHALHDPDVIHCSFCMQFYLFRALEKAGMYEETMPLWEQWKTLIFQDLTTIPENPGQPRSDCHGWGSVPLYEFPSVWLGVNPGKPGWETISIRPRTDLIRDLSGTCHTPKGPVFVSWTRKSTDCVHLWIQAPPEADAEVSLPDGQRVILKDGSYDGDILTEMRSAYRP